MRKKKNREEFSGPVRDVHVRIVIYNGDEEDFYTLKRYAKKVAKSHKKRTGQKMSWFINEARMGKPIETNPRLL